MRKLLTKQMMCAACAAAVSGSLLGQNMNKSVFNQALDGLSGENATQMNFDAYYQSLNATDNALSLWLSILFPWLAQNNSDAWARIGGGTGGSRGVSNTPLSNSPTRGGPVTTLTITQFAKGATSFWFRVEWPSTLEIPWGQMYLMGKLNLAKQSEWSYLMSVDVDPLQGYKVFEVTFAELICSSMEGLDFSKAFFRFHVPDPEEPWGSGGGGGSDEDEGTFAAFLTPLDDYPDFHEVFLSSGYPGSPVALTESVQVEPGLHYLIYLTCTDLDLYHWATVGRPFGDCQFSWTITVPGMTPFTGSTDTDALCDHLIAEDNLCHLQDFWFVSIPTNITNPSIQVKLAVTPISPSPSWMGPGWLHAYITPIELSQANMPEDSLPTTLHSTDTGKRKMVYLTEGGTALITGEPNPPLLTASLATSDGTLGLLTIDWRMEVTSERPIYRKKLDDRKYPANGSYHPSNPLSYASINVTQNLMGNEVIGGKCTLYCRATDFYGRAKTNKFNFLIRGVNPTDAVVKDYITDVMPARYKPYAWAIARHESREPKTGHVYNQFNTVKGAYLHLPNKTSDDKDKKGNPIKQWGWGIGQLDRKEPPDDPTTSTYYVTTAEVFHWRTNIHSMVAVFDEKRGFYEDCTNLIYKTYAKKEWVALPATMTFSNTVVTPEQFGVTVFYNGNKGVKETRVLDKNGKDYVLIKSPLHFDKDKPAPQRWSLADNHTNYAYKVSLELPPNTPPKATEP